MLIKADKAGALTFMDQADPEAFLSHQAAHTGPGELLSWHLLGALEKHWSHSLVTLTGRLRRRVGEAEFHSKLVNAVSYD